MTKKKILIGYEMLLRLWGALLAVLLSIEHAAALSSEIEDCIEIHKEHPQNKEYFGISEGAVREILSDIRRVTGVFLADLEIVECPGLRSAYAFRDPDFVPGQTLGRYIIYDPEWLRPIVGENRLEALVIFSHELGHFVNSHFDYAIGSDPKNIESEADYFSGCTMARLEDGSDGWAALSSIYTRLRDRDEEIHPNQSESLEAARAGYETCWIARSGQAAPPGKPITPDEQRYIEALNSWVRDESSDINYGRAVVATFTSALLDNRLPSVALLTEVLKSFQDDFGLPATGEFDRETVQLIREGIEDGIFVLKKDAREAERVVMTGYVDPFVIGILVDATRMRELHLSGVFFGGEPGEFSALAELRQVSLLSIRGVKDATDEIVPFIGKMSGLSELILRETNIADISALGSLTELRRLDLEQSRVVDISPLRRLRKLERLSLHGTSVGSLTALRGLRQLEQIEISFTPITDVSPLVSLPNLSWIEAWNTEAVNLGALAGIRSLDIADLRGPTLSNSDLLRFADHPNLEFLIVDARWQGTDAANRILAATPDLAMSFR